MNNSKYYKAIALLYEKELGVGYISLENLILPQELSNIQCGDLIDKLLTCGGDSVDFIKAIGKIISNYKLDKNFCDIIKNSQGLRFMLCNSLHDSFVENVAINSDNLALVLNCSDCISKPVINGESISKPTIVFSDCENLSYIQDKRVLVGLDYIGHEIDYSQGINAITVKIELCKQVHNQPSYRYLTLNCKDIKFVSKE